MALSNIFSMTQMQSRDFQAAQNLMKMGCKMPENPAEAGKNNTHGGLAGIVAEGCPKDDVQLSKAVQAELKALDQLQSGHGPKAKPQHTGKGGDADWAATFKAQSKAESKFLNAPMEKFFKETGRKPAEVNFETKMTSDKLHQGFSDFIK